jgi:hypothetical protein
MKTNKIKRVKTNKIISKIIKLIKRYLLINKDRELIFKLFNLKLIHLNIHLKIINSIDIHRIYLKCQIIKIMLIAKILIDSQLIYPKSHLIK